MAKTGMNLQDSFLNQVRKDNTEITLVMLDGTRLSGLVRGFDNFTVILNSRGSQHLIYKHAIAQIVSRRAAHSGEGEHGGETQAHSGGDPRREQREPREQRDPPRGEQRPSSRPPQGQAQPGGAPAPQSAPPAGPQTAQAPRPQGQDRRNVDHHARDKFNTLDLSSLKVDEEKTGD